MERPAALQPPAVGTGSPGIGNKRKCQNGRPHLCYPYFSAIEPGITTAYIYFYHNLPALVWQAYSKLLPAVATSSDGPAPSRIPVAAPPAGSYRPVMVLVAILCRG